MKPKLTKLVIGAWPQLLDAINRQQMLGSTPEEIATFLVIEGLERRQELRFRAQVAKNSAIASGWRGDLT